MSAPYITHMDDIVVVYVDMPRKGRELVTRNIDGSHTILINSRLSSGAQAEAARHALEHIRRGDFDDFDVQEIERRAHEDI